MIADANTDTLVSRFQAGDGDAFREIYLRYFDRVYNYLRVVSGDTHHAEDLAQQAFAQALEALPRYKPRGSFDAWLFTIVRNLAIRDLRKRGRVDLLDPAELNELQQPVEPAELSALSWIVDRELLMLVERLPLRQRQVVELRFMLDLTTSEIATVLDIRPNQVAVLQYRAVGFLRDRLTALGREPSDRRHERMLRCPRQARVLRRRRFALYP